GTDVEQTAAERYRDRQPREYERRRIEERVADSVNSPKGAREEELVDKEWIIAYSQNYDPSYDECGQHGQQGKEESFKQSLHRPFPRLRLYDVPSVGPCG